MPVTAAQLIEAYKGNEVRGDATFKGKRVRVSGRAGDIKKGIGGGMYITVGTGATFDFPTVQCPLSDDQTSKAIAINKGDPVVVEGVVKGLMMNVVLSGCVLQLRRSSGSLRAICAIGGHLYQTRTYTYRVPEVTRATRSCLATMRDDPRQWPTTEAYPNACMGRCCAGLPRRSRCGRLPSGSVRRASRSAITR